jgi:hypothetical protein
MCARDHSLGFKDSCQCQFYQEKQDPIDVLVRCFKAGPENNEFCMWVTSELLCAQEAGKRIAASFWARRHTAP